MKTVLIKFLLFFVVLIHNIQGLSQTIPFPVFSNKAGNYPKAIELSLTSPDKSQIYFTVNGDNPIPGIGQLYSRKILIEKTTVIRACLKSASGKLGPIATHTFLINEKTNLPIVCVTAPPDSLFHDSLGVYKLYYFDLECAGHFEFILPKEGKVFDADVGYKVTGAASRSLAKKSLRVVSRGKYGPEKLEYPFFPDIPVRSFDGLLLRADATTGVGRPKHRAGERVRNELVYHFNREMGSHVDMQAYRPAILFLNGEYWGMYSVMERKDDDFIFSHYGIKDIDMLDAEDLYEEAGDKIQYKEVLAYMNNNNLDDPKVWKRLNEYFDMESFIDYWVMNTYTAAFDFEVNIRFWRPRTPEGKWRWISYDNDSWGDPEHDFLYEITEPENAKYIFLMNRLMQGKYFRTAFLTRLSDCLNSTFMTDNVKCYIEEIRSYVIRELSRDRAKWEGKILYVLPGADYAAIREFAELRPAILREQIMDIYDLEAPVVLHAEVEPQHSGYIQINSIAPSVYPWNGLYFQEMDCEVKATPESGFVFDHWEGDLAGSVPSHTLKPGQASRIKAIFRKK